jgi:hypothetical protein
MIGSSQSEPARLQIHGFVNTMHDTTCKIWVWCYPGCGARGGKFASATLC